LQLPVKLGIMERKGDSLTDGSVIFQPPGGINKLVLRGCPSTKPSRDNRYRVSKQSSQAKPLRNTTTYKQRQRVTALFTNFLQHLRAGTNMKDLDLTLRPEESQIRDILENETELASLVRDVKQQAHEVLVVHMQQLSEISQDGLGASLPKHWKRISEYDFSKCEGE